MKNIVKLYVKLLTFIIGRPILELDAEDVDEIEKLNRDE